MDCDGVGHGYAWSVEEVTFITVAYLAIIDEPIAVTGQDDAAKTEWWPEGESQSSFA